MESDKDTSCFTIPNLEFVVTHMNELGRLHKTIKDYVNAGNEHSGRVAKSLRFSLQEKINSYYFYVNNWVSTDGHNRQESGFVDGLLSFSYMSTLTNWKILRIAYTQYIIFLLTLIF